MTCLAIQLFSNHINIVYILLYQDLGLGLPCGIIHIN